MRDGSPEGGRIASTIGYYSNDDVPVTKWTVSLDSSGIPTDGNTAVVGGLGDIFIINPSDPTSVISIANNGLLEAGWKSQLTSPAYWLLLSADGSMLYVAQQDTIVVLNPNTGSVISKWGLDNSPSRPTVPVVADVLNGLLLLSYPTFITAVSLSSGQHIWNSSTAECIIGSRPVVTGDVIAYYCTVGGSGFISFASPRYGTLLAERIPVKGISSLASQTFSDTHNIIYLSGEGGIVAVCCTLYKVLWSTGTAGTSPASVFVSPSNTITAYWNNTVITMDVLTGKLIKQIATQDFTFPSKGGLMDNKGSLYGTTLDGTRVALLSFDNVQWSYQPLNCSVPNAVRGIPYSFIPGPSSSVYMFAYYSRKTWIAKIGRQTYPSCSSVAKCSCSGDLGYALGPRTCAWCESLNSCIEVINGSEKGMYKTCPSITKTPCSGLSTVSSELKTTPGTPTDIQGTWRAIPVEQGAQSQESKYVFTETTLSINGSSAVKTFHTSDNSVSYKLGSDQFNCVFEVLPPGPETRNTLLACGGANKPAPLSPEIAMCAKDGDVVLFSVKCIVPSVQHPPCNFDDEKEKLGTGQCGDACQLFSDCPSSCGCSQGSSGGLCCGGGECPTPEPPPSPPPTPSPPPSPPTPSPSPVPTPPPSSSCGSHCSGDAECSVGGGRCALCFAGQCGSKCGGICELSSDCVTSTCPYCNSHGQCQSQPSPCLLTCVTNSDCSSECSTCFAISPHPGKCGSNCGDVCTSSDQCLGGGDCSTCKNGRCGGALPPPSARYTCQIVSGQPTCVNVSTDGYPKSICDSICGVQPSGNTPGGLVGSWLGINIKKGYTKGEWVFEFSDKQLIAREYGSIKYSATVSMLGPGLFFRTNNSNNTAIWGIAASTSGSDATILTIAMSPPGGDLPIDFTEPMLDGSGVFVLVKM